MIKEFVKSVWDILVAVGEARQANYKRTGHAMWY
jgi:hypothetical protein